MSNKFKGIKNKVRGFEGALRKKDPRFKNNFVNTREFSFNYRSYLIDSRISLNRSDYESFLSWSYELLSRLPEIYKSKQGKKYAIGRIYTDAPEMPLEKEIFWVSCYLKKYSKELSVFILSRKKIESLFLNEQYLDALYEIDELENNQGRSLWGMKLKIALYQKLKGLEEQKRLTQDYRNDVGPGLINYILYMISVRNEDRSSIENIVDNLSKQLKKSELDESANSYLRYSISGILPDDKDSLSGILKIEQSNSVTDLFITYEKVINKLKCSFPAFYKKDFDVIDCFYSMRLNFSEELIGSLNIGFDYFFTKLISLYKDNPSNEFLFFLMFCLRLKPEYDKYFNGFHFPVFDLVIDIFSERKDVRLDCSKVIKELVNFDGFDLSQMILGFFNDIFRSSFKTPLLNKLFMAYDVSLELIFNKLKFTEIYKIIEVRKFIQKGDYEQGVVNLELVEGDILFIDFCISSLKLECLYNLDKSKEVMEFVSNECCSEETIKSFLPITEAIRELDTNDYKISSPLLLSPIVLYNDWVRSESTESFTDLRYFFKNAIKKLGCAKPSELTFEGAGLSKDLYIFFLNKVCIPSVIDSLKAINSTVDVLNERIEICQKLIAFNSSNKAVYQDEMLLIKKQIQLQEGRRFLDSTRIYVDSDSLSRWAKKNISEDYYRFKDISGLNPDMDFDDSGVDYTGSEEDVDFDIDLYEKNEANSLLFEIVNKFVYQFLTNSSFGLDYYLSKRIRHQSFVGLIRSHYEFSDLIVNKDAEDKGYQSNSYWMQRFKALDVKSINKLDDCFKVFSEEFDKEIFSFRDEKLHIRSKEHPEGLIQIKYAYSIQKIIYDPLSKSETLDEFIDYLNFILNILLAVPLQETREYVDNIFKAKLANIAHDFRSKVNSIAGRDPEFNEFDRVLSERSTAVQHSLDEVIRWFTPAASEDIQTTFSLEEMINISVDGIKSLFNSFSPDLELKVSSDREVQMIGENLVFINDVLFILFDNAKQHSGLERPKISLLSEIRDSSLIIDFKSSVATSLLSKHEKEILKIKDFISKGDLSSRTKKEGKSGIIKIAASLSGVDGAMLDYGFDDGDFYIKVVSPIGEF
ncbi:hypothetical protein [Marinomonas colpomeniae]|uniref:Uncharacterized protein n=1 Tax=Marinomonas colpomeniae TaxID=2774408 RepID=A0ABR8P461_9GAMM|nr:hypothetical protein [Marinomonas colpomeniae]MBD5772660.1 hypothetical protein [Marinomonas colpomeniae]